MSAGENQAGGCLREGVAQLRSPTGRAPHAIFGIAWGPRGDDAGGGTAHQGRSPSHGSRKQQATGTGVLGPMSMSCRTEAAECDSSASDADTVGRKEPRLLSSQGGPLAQLVEQRTLNPRVGGSSPPRLTIFLLSKDRSRRRTPRRARSCLGDSTNTLCESGGTGRRARLRIWWPTGRGGSSPPFRTTV